MPKRIFILNGHPAETSLSRSLAEAYAQAAEAAGHEVRLAHLNTFAFDMDFGRAGYSDPKPLEPDLAAFLEHLKWAEHFVLVTPMWWGGLPARLQGLIERAFLPGHTFDTRGRAGKMPKPMLSGRSGRVVFTSDTPSWYLRFVYGNPFIKRIRKQILGFVGIRPARITHFTPASHASQETVNGWLAQVRELASTGS